MKRLLTFFICTIVLMCTTNTITANAKVLEPTLVSTESWTTSYFIDDDMDTLYPYIDCQADIYNDGSLKVYMWNSHEWDGFATVKHDVCFYYSNPIASDSVVYSLIMNGEAETTYYCYKIDNNCDTVILQDRISFYPNTYSENGPNAIIWSSCGSSFSLKGIDMPLLRKWQDSNKWENCTNNPEYPLYSIIWTNIALPNIPFSKNTDECIFTFNPTSKTNFNENQYFRLFGHDIMITPEILSGNTVATPQLTDQEKYIQELESENARLKSMLDVDSIVRFDTDGNGIIDAKDATTILKIYAINSTGGNIQTLDDLKNYN